MPTLIEALQSLRAILARGPQRKIVPYTDPEIKAAIHAVMRAANETDEMTGQEIDGFLASKVNLRLMPLPAPPMILRQLDTMIGDMGGSKPEGPNADGPVEPDGFRHAGKVYSPLARGPFRALAVAWQSEGRCLDSRDLSEPLYGDREEELNDSTLRDLRGKLNDFFRTHDIPYKATVRGYSIAIKDGAPSAARPAKRARPGRKKPTRR